MKKAKQLLALLLTCALLPANGVMAATDKNANSILDYTVQEETQILESGNKIAENSDEDANIQVGDSYYATLQEAVAAAKDNGIDTVTLLKDIDFTKLAIAGSIVIDLAGLTLDLNQKMITANNFSLLFQGSNAKIINGTLQAANNGAYALFIGDMGDTDNFIVENVTTQGGINIFNATNVVLKNVSATGRAYYAVWCDENAHVTIEDGSYSSAGYAVLGMSLTVTDMYILSGEFIAGENQPMVLQGEFNTPVISGGTFNQDVGAYTIPGTKWDEESNGIVADVQPETSAVVGNVAYSSLADAFEAVNQTPDGKPVTLKVLKGTFTPTADEQLIITRDNVVIEGEGAGETTIECGGFSCSGQAGILITANNVTLKNITVTSTTTDENVAAVKVGNPESDDAAKQLKDCSLENLVLSSGAGHALNLHGVNGCTVTNISVNSAGKYGLAMANAKGVTVTGSTLNGEQGDIGMMYKKDDPSYAVPCELTLGANNTFGKGNIYSERTDGEKDSVTLTADQSVTIVGAKVLEDGNTLTTTAAAKISAEDGVFYYPTLQDALADVPKETETTVTLVNDIALSETLIIPPTSNIVLDLNSKTISSDFNGDYCIENNGVLTLSNGTVTGAAYALANNGVMTVNGGSYTGKTAAIYTGSNHETIVNSGSFSSPVCGYIANTNIQVTVDGRYIVRALQEGESSDASHSWNDGEEIKAATCTENGEKTLSCTVCGATRKEEIAALGHKYVYSANDNEITESCANGCGHSATAAITAEGGIANNSNYTAAVAYSDNWVAGKDTPIVYTLNNQIVTETSSAGTYSASITIGEATASTTFSVTARRGGGGSKRNPSKNDNTPETPPPSEPDNTSTDFANRFADVQKGDWYYDSIQYVYDQKLMNGISSDMFGVNDAITRGMIVTILYRLDGEPKVGSFSFADVAQGQYYTNAVAWAAENGIVEGYDSATFGPDNNITREQLAAILYRYTTYKGYDVTNHADISGFTDAQQISHYALDAIQWAIAEKLITGITETTLVPDGNAVRAQAATILARFCQNIVK